MKKIKVPVIVIILISASIMLFYSCINKKNQEWINKIDSLKTELNTLTTKTVEMNIDSIHSVYDIINSNIEKLNNNSFVIPQNSEDKTKLANYGGIQKLIKKNMAKMLSNQKDLSYTLLHLDDLKHDIRKNLITDSLIQIYYSEEEKIVERIKLNLEKNIRILNNQMDFFEELNPEVEAIIAKKQ